MNNTNPAIGNTAAPTGEDAPRCAVCDGAHGFQWTDTHGVGVCYRCGTPYKILHYEGNARVNKPPEMALSESGLLLAKRYWSEKQRRVFPGAYDICFLGGRDTTYSGATREDERLFQDWMDQQPEVIAARESAQSEQA